MKEEAPDAPKINVGKQKSPRPVNRAPAAIISSDPFEAALQSRYKEKMRRNKEVNALINALKSVNKDYQKNH